MTGVPAVAAPPPSQVARRAQDLVLAGTGLAVLVLASLPVDATSVPPVERTAFRVLNGASVLPFAVVWPVMQLGNLLAVPAAAAVAAGTRRWRLSAGLLLGGVGTYLLAKVVKGVVVRGRPAALLDDVHIRGAAALGRGFLSGHAAVVALLLVLAWPHVGRRVRWVLLALAGGVCLARVNVGAHLPLDVVAGAGLGVAVGGAVRLLLGRPVSCS